MNRIGLQSLRVGQQDKSGLNLVVEDLNQSFDYANATLTNNRVYYSPLLGGGTNEKRMGLKSKDFFRICHYDGSPTSFPHYLF